MPKPATTEYSVASGITVADFPPKLRDLGQILAFSSPLSLSSEVIGKKLGKSTGYVVIILNKAYKMGLVNRIGVFAQQQTKPRPSYQQPYVPPAPPPVTPPPAPAPPPPPPPPVPPPPKDLVPAPLKLSFRAFDMVPDLMIQMESFNRQLVRDITRDKGLTIPPELKKLIGRYLAVKDRAIFTDSEGRRARESAEEWAACWRCIKILNKVTDMIQELQYTPGENQ